MSNGKDKKKSNSPGPHGMHSVTSQHSGEVKVKKRKKKKHIKYQHKASKYSYNKDKKEPEVRQLYQHKASKYSYNKDKKKSNGEEEDIFAKRDKYRKSFWETGPNVKVRNKGLAGAEVTKKGGAYAYYRKNSKAAQLFRKAFADAKAAGKKTFTWDGRLYTTETAE